MTTDPFDDAVPPDNERFRCPGCEEEVDVPVEAVDRLVRCPYCNTDFFASEEMSRETVVDDTDEAAGRTRDDEINAVRVRHFSALRMAAIRTRSWWIVGATIAVLAAVEFFAKAALIAMDNHRWGGWSTLCAAVVVAAVWFARFAWRQVRQIQTEIDRPTLTDPDTPPDFSTLGDGRDAWKRLENIR